MFGFFSPHRLLELDKGSPTLLSSFLKDTGVGGNFSAFRFLSIPNYQIYYLLVLPRYLDFYLAHGSENLCLI